MPHLKMHLKKLSNVYILLFFILLIGIFFRVLNINNNPPRLTNDEMSIGFNAYSILKTGKDEWAKPFPLDFAAFGDHKLPGTIYTAIPFIHLLGLNSLSLRMTSIVFGLSLIPAAYWIGKVLSQDKWVGLIMAALAAISPWTVHISRMLLESNLALAFYALGIVSFIKAYTTNQKKYLYLTAVFFALTLYYYVAYRLISPLTLILAMGLYLKGNLKRLKPILISFFIFGLIALPIFFQIINRGGEVRFDQLSIIGSEGIEAQLFDWRNHCVLSVSQVSPKLAQGCRFVGSPILIKTKNFSRNYLSSIFPTFIFLQGDSTEYLSNQNFAEFYFFLSVFYLAGIYYWLRQSNNHLKLMPLILLAAAPIPGALVGGPQVVRASAMTIPITFFTAFGIVQVYQKLKFKKLKLCFALGLFILTFFYAGWYLFHENFIYALKADQAYFPLPTAAVKKTLEIQDDYEEIYINREFPGVHIAVAFYGQMDPVYYQEEVVRPDPDEFGFSHPTRIGKYSFTDLSLKNLICNTQNSLFLTKNNIEFKPWMEFRNSTGVHVQAQLYDIELLKSEMEPEQLNSLCPSLFNE